MTKVLEVEHLFKSYPMAEGEPYPVLKDINFTIDEGEFVAIMGPSGSGKSTLMNTLGCLDTPTSGIYKIGGEVVSGINDDQLADIRSSKIGFVFQGFNLLMKRSLVDNVSIPLIYAGYDLETQHRRAADMLEHVKLGKFIDRLPSQISGGMQQRVAIARALINHPKIILADEPTGNLDTKTSVEIMNLFQELNEEGKTIVLVTHEPDIADFAKRLIYIVDGVVHYDGPVKDFKGKNNG